MYEGKLPLICPLVRAASQSAAFVIYKCEGCKKGADMDYKVIILNTMAGLGMFLYGMKCMSDGLQKVAGDKMRDILERCTKNRFLGLLVGIIFTGIIQSSNAATVMVVSFVNAGLMSLMQAVGIIFGANIGTTITGQLVALDLAQIAPVFLLAGVIMVMFLKNPTVKKVGEVIAGFGILFLGMNTMKSAVQELKDSADVIRVMSSLQNPFLAVFLGFIATAILQSSSATVGILILLASQGVVPLDRVFYIVLGCNIGACVSAVLTSFSGNKNAKRAAMIHFLFNILGSVLMFVILTFGADWLEKVITAITPESMDSAKAIAKDVANTHSLFKIFQVIVFFPLGGLLVKMTYWLIPGDDGDAERETADKSLQYIGEHMIFSPATAVPQSVCEIVRMGNIARGNLELAMGSLLKKDDSQVKDIYNTEETLDYLNTEITNYLVRVNQISLPVADRKLLGGLFHVVNDIERIGDHAVNITEILATVLDKDLEFSDAAKEELQEMLNDTCQLLDYSLEMFSNRSNEHLKVILELENCIDEKERRFQKNHIQRLTSDQCQPHAGIVFSDLCSGLERVADHATNIAFSILDENPETKEETAAAQA